MTDRALEIANLLLRDGALRRSDAEHREVRQELMGNSDLFEDVRGRLKAVGFELVQSLGHLGVRIAPSSVPSGVFRNRMGLHAGHIRLIVYLWTHLVYREAKDLRHDQQSAPPGAEQVGMFVDGEAEEAPFIAYSHVSAELGETMRKTYFKGLMNALRRWRFIRFDEKRDRIWADASLYTLVDLHKMEDFVVSLAQRLGTDDTVGAVVAVVTGSESPNKEQAE